jgi:hypothetical protein
MIFVYGIGRRPQRDDASGAACRMRARWLASVIACHMKLSDCLACEKKFLRSLCRIVGQHRPRRAKAWRYGADDLAGAHERPNSWRHDPSAWQRGNRHYHD